MNIKRFDWDLIRSFLAVIEHGSLLGAARMLGASQPTLGRRMAELEQQLGMVLFERTGRGLRATEAALRVADAARLMEQGAQQLAQDVSRAQTGLEGTVRLTASTPVACHLLPGVLAQLRQQMPQIQIEVVASNAVSNLLRREADIALRMVQPHQSSLIARRIGKVTLGTYAHTDYLRRRGTPRHARDLLRHDLIGYDRDEQIIRGFNRAGLPLKRESFCVRCDDFIAYWQFLRAGMGVGFVSDYMGRSDAQLERLLPDLELPALPLWLAVHREIRTSPRIRAVYDHLAEHLGAVLR